MNISKEKIIEFFQNIQNNANVKYIESSENDQIDENINILYIPEIFKTGQDLKISDKIECIITHIIT